MFFGQNLAGKTSAQTIFKGNAMKLFLTALVIVGAFFCLSLHLFCSNLFS